MIKVVSWNIAKRTEPWRELAKMARNGEADVALLQEAGSPPGDLVDLISYEDDVFWNRGLYDRWPLVVRLSDRVEVERFRQVPPVIGGVGERDIGASGIGTMAAARVAPAGRPEETFVAVSMYASWIGAHPSTHRRPGAPQTFRRTGSCRTRPSSTTRSGCRRPEHVLRRDRPPAVDA